MLSLLVFSQAQKPEKPEKKAIQLPGDIVLGGLFPIHEKDGSSCGTKIYNRGVQRLEAMLFAVDKINADKSILPNITLGVHILDTCGRDTYALEQSLHFVRASLSFDLSTLQCEDKSSPTLKPHLQAGPMFGVVGGSYSSVSLQVANLLRLFHIPQISPASTATALSDKTRFDYFARTVPPDNFQSMALVDVVKSFNWSYVSTVYSEGSYGESGIQHFTSEANNRNVCVAAAEKVPSTANETTFDNIIQKLAKKPNARSVVLFTRAEDARRILQAADKATRANLTQPFQWIASDGWGRQTKLVEGYEEEAVGAITVELQSRNIPGFDDYMASLTPENNTRNPWFGEYWMDACTRTQASNACDKNFTLVKKYGYEQESKVQFVVDAVYAFALALDRLQRDVCGVGTGMCANMSNYDKGDFYQHYLLNVSFKGEFLQCFQFGLILSSIRFDKVLN